MSFLPAEQIPSENGKAAFAVNLPLPAQGSGQPYTLSDLQGLPLLIQVQNLKENIGEHELSGRLADFEWEFPFVLDYQSISLLTDINETVQKNGNVSILNSIQISPLSVLIKGDVVHFGPEGKRHPEVSIIFSDGTQLNQFYSDDMSTWTDGYRMEFEAYYLLNRPLDMKKVEKIIVDGVEFPVNMFKLTMNN